MKRILSTLALVFAFTLSGCYHTTVLTGQPESNRVVEKQWQLFFIYGLVPMSDVDVSQECPAGVARVETQHTFLNQLVGFLSAGLVTPVQVTVTCAASAATGALLQGTDAQEVLQQAAEQSLRQGEPVFAQVR